MAFLYFFAGIPCTFDDRTGFQILDFSTDKGSAFTGLYMLEFNNLPYLAVNFNRYTWSEIITCNHV